MVSEKKLKKEKKKKRIISIYSSSLFISIVNMIIVITLELLMLVFTFIDKSLYGPYLLRYRMFYIALLSMAVIYILITVYVKQDMEKRYIILHIANPLCAIFLIFWSLAITQNDALINGTVDPTVFMTLSITVPLSFYLAPVLYGILVLLADSLMIYLIISTSGFIGLLINTSVFLVFQFVLGLSFLVLKKRLAERIVEEQNNADIDVMTRFPNRRVYEADLKKYLETGVPDNLLFFAIDINGLKDVNDNFGHDTGDQLIIGAAECIDDHFAKYGKAYRTGGDEFVAMIVCDEEQLPDLLKAYEESMAAWSEKNNIRLTTSYGYVSHKEFPDMNITELAKAADDRMYAAKAAYYRHTGRERRRY